MATLRRKSRTLIKDEDILDPVKRSPNEPAVPAPPEARQPPGQVPASSRRGSRCDTAEQKRAATPSPTASLRRKSLALPEGEDAFKLAKPPSTMPASAEARHPTGQVPGTSRRGSGYCAAEENAATPAPPVANIRRKSLAVSKGEGILDIAKPLAPKPISPAPRDVPQQQAPLKSKQGSWFEPQAYSKARSDALGQKGVTAGGPQKSKGSRPSYKQESQLYMTAEEAPKGHQQPEPPKKGYAQLPSYQSDLDDQRTNMSWPCMLCTMTLLIALVFFLIFFMVKSSEKLSLLEKTTISSTPVAHTTMPTLEREIVESTTQPDPAVPASAECATTIESSIEEEEDDDAQTMFATTVHGDVDEEALTPPWAETS
ncbi:uncharacterized protein [Dermacentor albipictus]|uniref:uncharacterized protein n=1 Tax=Dermacentor albipictus TaxID=60249 RepID=UPI0038FCCBB8